MTTDRAAFTAALRELADYLDANPDVPVPTGRWGAKVDVFPAGTDDEARAEVDRVAAVLGAPIEDGRHYRVERVFGGRVTYQAVAIPTDAMARYHAVQSYAGSVTP